MDTAPLRSVLGLTSLYFAVHLRRERFAQPRISVNTPQNVRGRGVGIGSHRGWRVQEASRFPHIVSNWDFKLCWKFGCSWAQCNWEKEKQAALTSVAQQAGRCPPKPKGPRFHFPVRAQAWVADQVPGCGAYERQPHTDVSLAHRCFSLSLSHSLPLSLKINA